MLANFIITKTGIWGDHRGDLCKIESIEFEHNNDTLKVCHNLEWTIYTSKTFEEKITALVQSMYPNMNIEIIVFSEQGLQQTGIADMDVIYFKD